MKTEEQLLKELEKVREKKKEKHIQETLDKMTLVGKCYASHLLTRYPGKRASYSFEVIHLIGKEYRPDDYHEYVYTGERISVNKNGDEFEVELSNYSCDSPNLFKYEISLNEFNTVKMQLIPAMEAAVNDVRKSFIASDYVSNGEYHNESKSQELLDVRALEYIELGEKEYKFSFPNADIYQLLRWNNYPYLYNSRLYKLPYWKEMIQLIIDNLKDNARIWGGKVYERDMPRAQQLQNFLDNQKE